jgi:proteasome alpha subunit
MTDEPYRWLEAVAQRREYVRDQIREATPVFAVGLPEGILVLGVGAPGTKVFEVHDRHAVAALGHPSDIERIRQAAIDAAHLEAFTRAPEDLSLRRLVGFSLSAAVKAAFENLNAAPVLAEFLFVELGASPDQDVFARLNADGGFSFTGRFCVAAARGESGIRASLESSLEGVDDRMEAARRCQEAWESWVAGETGRPGVPVSGGAPNRPSWEAAWLRRHGGPAARFEPLPLHALGLR